MLSCNGRTSAAVLSAVASRGPVVLLASCGVEPPGVLIATWTLSVGVSPEASVGVLTPTWGGGEREPSVGVLSWTTSGTLMTT